MKDRDEFLASVYAKRDAELVRQKKSKKRMLTAVTAAAACLVLMVGVSSMNDGLDLFGAVSSDGALEAVNEFTGEMEEGRDGAVPGSYYMLPCVTIEEIGDGDATAMHAAGAETVKKVQDWLDQLTEAGQVKAVDERLADITELKLPEPSYIVTIEWEPQQMNIYYLFGEVGWYE